MPWRILNCIWTHVSIKVNVFIQKNVYHTHYYVHKLCKTVCSEKNIPVLLKFSLGYYLALWKILRLVLLIKDYHIKHVQILTSTQIQLIFLQTKLWGFFLDYMCKILFRQFLARNKIGKFLKNMSLHRTGPSRDIKCQNFNSFFLKRWNEKLLLNLSDIKDFFTIERILSKALLKKTISILSMHPYHLGDVLDE